MRRVLPVILAIVAGIAIGYVLGSGTTNEAPSSTPPNPGLGGGTSTDSSGESAEVVTLRAELDRCRLENEELRERIEGLTALGRVGTAPGSAGAVAPNSLTPFPVAADGTQSPVRVAGDSGDPEKGALRVLVTGRDGAPVSGVEVKLTCYIGGGSARHEGRTGSEGWATFRKLPPERYAVAAHFPGPTPDADGPERFAYRNTHARVIPGRVTEVSVPRGSAGALVTGRVIDRSGKTYGGALVSLFTKETFFRDSFYGRADERGHYRIEDVPAGRYEMKASAGGVPYQRDPHAVISVSGHGTLEMDVVVGAPAGSTPLTGTVRDSETGKPIGGVRITSQGAARAEAVTNAEGRYALTGLGAGTHRFSVSKDGHAFRWLKNVEVTGEGDVLDIELSPATVLHLEVTDRDGRPAVGRLQLGFIPRTEDGQRLGTSVTTDGKGHAVYRQGMPGDYELRFSISGVGSATITKTLRPGDQSISVRLE